MEIAIVIGAVIIVVALIWAGTAIYGFRKVTKMQDRMDAQFGRTLQKFDEDFGARGSGLDAPTPRRVRR